MSHLNDDDFLRYQRQIALPEIGESGQKQLIRKRILQIGCGGLGTCVSLYLVGAGIGSVVVVDDDNVDVSNLHRQIAYREMDIGQSKALILKKQLQALNHHCKIRALNKRLDDEQLALEVMLADLVLDCSDNLQTRHQVNRICYQQKTDLISASAIGWEGQLSVYRYPNNGPCYQCLVPQSDQCPAVRCQDMGIVGPIVGVIASVQALKAIQLLLGILPENNHQTSNELLHFDGKNLKHHILSFDRNPACPVCGHNSGHNSGHNEGHDVSCNVKQDIDYNVNNAIYGADYNTLKERQK
jgi:sulfur carrier protein ThiS adenylyltransferase